MSGESGWFVVKNFESLVWQVKQFSFVSLVLSPVDSREPQRVASARTVTRKLEQIRSKAFRILNRVIPIPSLLCCAKPSPAAQSVTVPTILELPPSPPRPLLAIPPSFQTQSKPILLRDLSLDEFEVLRVEVVDGDVGE